MHAPSRGFATGRLAFRELLVIQMMWRTIEREPTRSWQTQEEFVVVWGEFGMLRVSRAVGSWIADMTVRRMRPRWIEFVDHSGALIRVRTSEVQEIYDSTPRSRAREREHSSALDKECDEW